VSNSTFAVADPAASPARGSCRAIYVFAIAAGALLLFAATAHGQGITERPERVDRPAPRELDGKTPEKSADKDFSIGIDVPLRRSSSVTSASVDSIVEDRPDSHVTPDVYVKWSHQYDWFKASAEVGASIDRYAKTPDANLDGLHSSFKIAKTDGKFEYFVPYATLSNEMFFLPTFKTPDITYNDFKAQSPSNLEISRPGAENILAQFPGGSQKVEDYVDAGLIEKLRSDGHFTATAQKYKR